MSREMIQKAGIKKTKALRHSFRQILTQMILKRVVVVFMGCQVSRVSESFIAITCKKTNNVKWANGKLKEHEILLLAIERAREFVLNFPSFVFPFTFVYGFDLPPIFSKLFHVLTHSENDNKGYKNVFILGWRWPIFGLGLPQAQRQRIDSSDAHNPLKVRWEADLPNPFIAHSQFMALGMASFHVIGATFFNIPYLH